MTTSPNSPRLSLDDRSWLLVLTGAGISAESGIPTFRDSGGLWEKHRVEDVASPDGFQRDPLLVWRFYSERREKAKECKPNPGHIALSEIEARLGDRFLLATQNIDGLHTAAGNERVVELHGNLFKTRCSVCDRPAFKDTDVYREGKAPACGKCHARGEFGMLRPHIVWFGEYLDPADLERVQTFMLNASERAFSDNGRFVFLAIGTSGAVYPAAGFVDAAKRLRAESWLVNAEPPENVGQFEHFVQGASGQVLPGFF